MANIERKGEKEKNNGIKFLEGDEFVSIFAL